MQTKQFRCTYQEIIIALVDFKNLDSNLEFRREIIAPRNCNAKRANGGGGGGGERRKE